MAFEPLYYEDLCHQVDNLCEKISKQQNVRPNTAKGILLKILSNADVEKMILQIAKTFDKNLPQITTLDKIIEKQKETGESK